MRSNHHQPEHYAGLPAVPDTGHQLAIYNAHGQLNSAQDDDVIDLREYWKIIWQRKMTVLIFLAMALIATTISTSLQPKLFKSSLTMQIERFSNAALSSEGSSAGYDYWAYEDFYQTQFELLKSYSLAERVAKDMNLVSAEQINGKPRPSAFARLLGLFRSTAEASEDGNMAESANSIPDPSRFAGALIGGLAVTPIENSRLATLSFESTSAEMSAKIVNTYADSFMQMNLERRIADSSYAQSFLNEQIKQVRASLEDSESVLVEYGNSKKIADLDQRLIAYQHKLQTLNGKLVGVEANRIEAQASYEQMRSAGSRGMSFVVNAELINSYKITLMGLESEYSNKLKVFKAAYPEMQQLKGQIVGLKAKITEEINSTASVLEARYKSAAREEGMLATRIKEVNAEVLRLRQRTTGYQALKRDVETNLVLYDSLLQQTKEIGVAAGISANNISVVDYALVPSAPFKPDLRKNLLLALALGLLGGIGLAFLFNKLDDTIKTSADLENLTSLSVLGIVPEVDKSLEKGCIGLLAYNDPTSALSEAYRSFKTALSLSTAGGYPRILQITSSGVGEGKTTTAIGVALTFIQSGSKVLLVDCDLRNPSIHRELNIPNTSGLTNYLVNEKTLGEVVEKSALDDKLFVVTAGPQSPNPAELLSSDAMDEFLGKAEEQFDIIIIDGPPVLGLADALVISNITYGTVLVVDSGETRKGILNDTIKRLRGVQANIIGTILTKYSQGLSEYNYLYNYYGTSREDESRKRLAS